MMSMNAGSLGRRDELRPVLGDPPLDVGQVRAGFHLAHQAELGVGVLDLELPLPDRGVSWAGSRITGWRGWPIDCVSPPAGLVTIV